jgi:hypothetical protein
MNNRNRMDLWLPSELAIQKAVDEVEKLGADVKLTDAVIMLSKVKELVSDYIEAHPESQPPAPSVNQQGREWVEKDVYDAVKYMAGSYMDLMTAYYSEEGVTLKDWEVADKLFQSLKAKPKADKPKQ